LNFIAQRPIFTGPRPKALGPGKIRGFNLKIKNKINKIKIKVGFEL
jgi:hypothetical protein